MPFTCLRVAMIPRNVPDLVYLFGRRYGDAIDAGAKMLADPDWYKQQGHQVRALANQASAYLGYASSNSTAAAAQAGMPSSETKGKEENGQLGSAVAGAGENWTFTAQGWGLEGLRNTSSKFTQYFVWPGVRETARLRVRVRV